jgi:hypothetical protein
MSEYILLGGLSFVAGLLVGRHIGMEFMKTRLVHYMMVVSSVQSIMNTIHTEHGLEEKVSKALKDAGYEIGRARVGGDE